MIFLKAPFIVLIFVSLIKGELVQEFISDNNAFTAAIYKEIVKINDNNILVSPFSLEISLAVAQSGANGETGQEIRTSVRLPNSQEQTESAIEMLLPKLKNGENYSLYLANKLYVDRNLTLKEQFKTIVTTIYQSDLENINFAQQNEAVDIMNKWVAKQTNDKIHDIVSTDDIDERTAAVLLNALYFKADWAMPFSTYSTQKETFYKTLRNTADVDMMHLHEKFFSYYEDAKLDATFLKIPFKGEDIAMVIVLPNKREGINDLEKQIDKVFVPHSFKEGRFNVGIPKFKFDSTINLKPILVNLGIKKAFDKKQADFKKISERHLFINTIRQKSFIDVNEIGVEATVATVIEWEYEAFWSDPPKNFVANHPFIFYIQHKDLILFVGKVLNPVY